jgi:diguanylate cyclase (GGDEF)-like protein
MMSSYGRISALKNRLPVVTKSLRTRLWVIIIITVSYLVYSSLADFIPRYWEQIGLPSLSRSILSFGIVLILLICLSGLALIDKMNSQVIRDGLTGLFNQNYIRQRLQEEYYRAKRYNHPLSLLKIDLDNFKSLNDRFGHAAGDHLLRYFGKLIPDTVRPSDIAASFGGEEFLIILPDTGKDEARAVAERLRQRIAESPFRIDSNREDILLTVSIGASAFAFPDYGQDAEEMITLADLALFQAKKAGNNSVSFYSSN